MAKEVGGVAVCCFGFVCFLFLYIFFLYEGGSDVRRFEKKKEVFFGVGAAKINLGEIDCCGGRGRGRSEEAR